MISTVASIFTGALLAVAPIINTPTENITDPVKPAAEVVTLTTVSHAVDVNTSFDELDKIQTEAEDAGLGFNYKRRGVKTRLVIDIVIESEDDYTLERLVVRAEDGTQYVEWTENEKGEAVAVKSAEF
jgi:hypothetical protein